MKSLSLNLFRTPILIGASSIAGLFLISCDRGPDKSTAIESSASAVVAKVEGGALNAFFPKDDGDFDVRFSSEKVGYAEAKLENDDVELATLAVSDTAGSPDMRAKYDAASMEIGGYPAITSGSKGTAVLAGRFQVKVRSTSDAFTASDREQWLQKFNLSGLADLAK